MRVRDLLYFAAIVLLVSRTELPRRPLVWPRGTSTWTGSGVLDHIRRRTNSSRSVLSIQFAAASAATFSPGLGGATGVMVSGLGTSSFASNSDMYVVSSTGPDVGGGIGPPAFGNLLRSFNGWFAEDGES